MRCFIHSNVEAIAVCKKCGKAMCTNCSSYSGHSGICPECRRDEYIAERKNLISERKSNTASIVKSSLLAAVFAIVAIALAVAVTVYGAALLLGTLIFAIRIMVLVTRRKPITDQIDYLDNEISILTTNLNKGSGTI